MACQTASSCKSQVKASDTFYDELVCFCKDMYDMDVYVCDKYGQWSNILF